MTTAATLHCWADRSDADPSWDRWADPDKSFTCMLPDGHDGPHRWTDDNHIGVEFAAPAGDE